MNVAIPEIDEIRSAIDPAERQRMWYEHLKSTARREAGRR